LGFGFSERLGLGLSGQFDAEFRRLGAGFSERLRAGFGGWFRGWFGG
jgi:hypothetical protein